MPSRLLAELVALVVPPLCAACRRPLGRAGEVLCAACRADLPWLRGPRCPRCALPAPCAPCPAAGSAVEAAWAPLAYDGTARAVVGALKFEGGFAVASVMAAQIVATAPPGLLAGRTAVPVPAHPGGARARGFDQAALVARAIARRAGLGLSACLERRGPGGRQLGAGREDRLAPGRLGVRVRGRAPARVLLVDDVHTTGATLDACARVIRDAGGSSVAAVAYARTLPARSSVRPPDKRRSRA
ncbi:MAG: double zinc ribbon domain-containing protein [Solirubrobacteraceae bacterium]